MISENGEMNQALTVKQYLGILALMLIPIANIVLLFIWGFGKEQNINRRNLSRALLIFFCIVFVLTVILFALTIFISVQINEAIIRGIPGR